MLVAAVELSMCLPLTRLSSAQPHSEKAAEKRLAYVVLGANQTAASPALTNTTSAEFSALALRLRTYSETSGTAGIDYISMTAVYPLCGQR